MWLVPAYPVYPVPYSIRIWGLQTPGQQPVVFEETAAVGERLVIKGVCLAWL